MPTIPVSEFTPKSGIIGVPVFIGCRHEHNINNITFSTVHMVD